MAKTTQAYDESSIQVLKGLEPVQQRPGMYTRLEDPTHIILEVVDNACDEALAGFAKKIHVTVHEDQSVSISDNGRGIPTGMHPTEHAPVIELVFTRLHAGGKFNKQGDGSAYKYSGGLHGVGVSVTNALTDRLDVNVIRDGAEHSIGFANGAVVHPLKKIGKADKSVSGTTVRAWPTAKYFDAPHVSHSELERTLRSKAMLLPGVEMTFTIEGKGSTTWHYPEGMAQYLNDVAEQPDWLFPPIKLDGEDINPDGGQDGLTCVLGFVVDGPVHRESFVNLIPTRDGGRHMQGLRYGAFQAVQQFMERHQLLPKNLKIEYDDVWARMSCVLAMRMVDPQFQGQTKDQLSSKHAAKLVEKIVSAQFELWLHENPQLAKSLAELVTEQAYKRSKNAPKSDRKRATGGAVLPGKLADCESTDVNHTELFLCEGDSAAGCFVYDTLIPLADGRKIPIGLMAEEQAQGKQHFVFTVGTDGNIEIAEAIDARKTKVATKIIELTLDNEKTIRCTPEHLFMRRDGTYIEAQHILSDMSLMPFNVKISNIKQHSIGGYEMIFNNNTNRWRFSHRLADQFNLRENIYVADKNKPVRHHVDFNKRNNDPKNIIRMDHQEHLLFHTQHLNETLHSPSSKLKSALARKTATFREAQRDRTLNHPSWPKFLAAARQNGQDPKNIELRNNGFKKWLKENPVLAKSQIDHLVATSTTYWKKDENREAQRTRVTAFFNANPSHRLAHSEASKKQWEDEALLNWRKQKSKEQWTPEFKIARQVAFNNKCYDETIRCLKLFTNNGTVDLTRYHSSDEYKQTKYRVKWTKFCEKFFHGSHVHATEAVNLFNHKVTSIKVVDTLNDVYDFEVPGTHNFALDAGIFVHNSSKMGRERKNQAILPLRGKILNTWGTETEALDSSKTIEDIITAIGVEPHGWDEVANLEGLRYGKIIIMADADVDGRHIQVLLLTLFLRHFPQLVTRGHIYLAQPPLFRVDAPFSKKVHNPMRKLYALDEEELNAIKKQLTKEGLSETQWSVNRFKGLGEMNPDQLCETTMHPMSRRLVQPSLTKEEWESVKASFDMMMNDKNASMRRTWMEKNGNDADIDI